MHASSSPRDEQHQLQCIFVDYVERILNISLYSTYYCLLIIEKENTAYFFFSFMPSPRSLYVYGVGMTNKVKMSSRREGYDETGRILQTPILLYYHLYSDVLNVPL